MSDSVITGRTGLFDLKVEITKFIFSLSECYNNSQGQRGSWYMITDGVDGNDGVDGAGGVNHGDGVVVDHDGGLVTHSFKSGPSPAYFHLFLVFFQTNKQYKF